MTTGSQSLIDFIRIEYTHQTGKEAQEAVSLAGRLMDASVGARCLFALQGPQSVLLTAFQSAAGDLIGIQAGDHGPLLILGNNKQELREENKPYIRAAIKDQLKR